MYKTITHKTTEEHYIDGKLVKPMPMPMPMAVPMPMPMVGEGLPLVVINEQTMLFRMNNRTLWTRYSLGMINFSVASFGRLPSAEVVAGNLKKSAAACGEYFTPYYGLTATRKVSSLLSVIAINGEKVVESLLAGRDIDAFETIWDKQIDELAKYLNELNPNHWPKDTLVDMFINLTGFWVDDFRARLAKDFAADAIALDNILKVAVSGIPNHTSKGYASIADLISKGIILQSPLAFSE
jgi:hypothetical protein